MKKYGAWILIIGSWALEFYIRQGGVDTHVQAIAPAILGALIAAGTGLAKAKLVDEPKEKRQRKLKAIEIALSPFTGLQPQTQIQEADPIGSAVGFGATGLNIGSQVEAQAAAQESAGEQTKLTNRLLDIRADQAKETARAAKAAEKSDLLQQKFRQDLQSGAFGQQRSDEAARQRGAASNFTGLRASQEDPNELFLRELLRRG